MSTMIREEVLEKTWILGVLDRCDSCQSQAFVKVTGINGDLLFCSHHYNKIMDNPESYKKMMAFLIEIVDEREKLIKDKPVGGV